MVAIVTLGIYDISVLSLNNVFELISASDYLFIVNVGGNIDNSVHI